MKNKKKKVIWLVIAFIFVAIFIACAVALFIDIFSRSPQINPLNYKEINPLNYKETVSVTDPNNLETENNGNNEKQEEEILSESEPEPEVILANGQTKSQLKAEHSYDIDKMRSDINTDVLAWISIPGTEVDHPVLYHETEPLYYERRDAFGKYSVYGCIFAQCYNDDDFRDPNTILYGHYVTEGGASDTFFGTLHRYKNPEFFETNRYIYVTTENRILVYDIFAAYEYDDRHILAAVDFSNDAEYENYLQNCLNPASMTRNVREGVELTAEDKIITLSTCTSYTNTSKRYLVQGVLVADVSR
ncbi:MAG: sortase [Ruminococcaceae bacterium]|nr:sortase [Oscillospiraceae bacterium]